MKPLASRQRPRSFEEFRGQKEALESIKNLDRQSVLFWGPPGSGKTTLALLLAEKYGMPLRQLSATSSGIGDLRKIIEEAQSESVLLFIDEIHRWNKAQQDALLPFVEDGRVVLLGATTENPGHYINRALLSRSKLLRLYPLGEEDLLRILRAAGGQDEDILKVLARGAGGDARRALSALEELLQIPGATPEDAEQVIGVPRGSRDEHYDVVSAWIKSMRGGDADAALYWMARMEEYGEDPRFLARRMIIFASEDIGLARSGAAAIASGIAQGVEMVGEPECWILLSHCTVYLSRAPHSRASYDAWQRAKQAVRHNRWPVPPALRHGNSVTRQFGEGQGYTIDQQDGFLPEGQERFLEED